MAWCYRNGLARRLAWARHQVRGVFPLMSSRGHEQIPGARLEPEAGRPASPQSRVVELFQGRKQARMRRNDTRHRGLRAHRAVQRNLRLGPGQPSGARVAWLAALVAVGGQVGHEVGER
jgi:hypothetical protein